MKSLRWVYLLFGIVVMIFLGTYQVWSIFRANLTLQFPSWSAPQISLAFTICMITFCLGLVVGGNLMLRLSGKGVALLSGLCLCTAFEIGRASCRERVSS
jgi:hypothetical protein